MPRCLRAAIRIIFRRVATCLAAVALQTAWRLKSDREFPSWGLELIPFQQSNLPRAPTAEHFSFVMHFRIRRHQPCIWMLNWLHRMAGISHYGLGPKVVEVLPKDRGTCGYWILCRRM